MNAAPTLGLPTMEDPFTDTMEMASPYTGHVDDFEIDIDIMEDQPSNLDNDFDVQDASPAAANDADMMEDVPEMTVTESHYNDTGNTQYTGTSFYSSQAEPVESEMVDEEYDHDHNIISSAPETLDITAGQDEITAVEPAEGVKDIITSEEEKQDEQYRNAEPVETDDKTIVQENVAQETNEQELEEVKADIPQVVIESQVESVTEPHPVGDNDHTEHDNEQVTNTTNVEEQDRDFQPEEAEVVENDKSDDLRHLSESHEAVEAEREARTEQHPSYIHPVKVIYQESEISMFPPRDGDTSETYFLANEGLAHENINCLLKECRTILGDHASNEDSLVFQIDSLGIELSEDNVHTDKVNLSQIVDIYLHLCRNSGIDNPEPLYLTLNTRPNLSAELADLLKAANEGKGISEIQVWEEEYQHHESEAAGTSSGVVPSEKDVGQGDDQGEHIEQLQSEREDVQNEEENKLTDDQHEPEPETESSEIERQPKDDEIDGANDGGDDQSANLKAASEPQYDFEETNSTATLTQHRLVESEDLQQEVPFNDVAKNEPDAVDDGFEIDEFHDEQGFDEEHPADEDENKSLHINADRTDAAEGTVAAEGDFETASQEGEGDKEETIDGYGLSQHDENEYNEESDEEEHEGYADEEYHEVVEVGNDAGEDLADGNEDTGEIPVPEDEQKNGPYTTDQLDQVSSDTVSVSNELLGQSEVPLDDLQPITDIDATEDHDDVSQQIPDFPDFPDDDLLSLNEDIFANPEEDSNQEAQDDNSLLDQVDNTDADTRNGKLRRQGSNVSKRPRDEEGELDLDGTPSPSTKRTRSS